MPWRKNHTYAGTDPKIGLFDFEEDAYLIGVSDEGIYKKCLSSSDKGIVDL